MYSEEKHVGRAKGGKARAEALTPERRASIASKAAEARWRGGAKTSMLVAEFGAADRPLRLLDKSIPCYVLSDGTRVLTQEGFLSALGRAKKAKGGTGASKGVDNTPSFLSAKSLKSLISEDILRSTTPIKFRLPTGGIAYGYRAELLPQVCNVYLRARDLKLLSHQQDALAKTADMLVRGLAETGIVALVDEATGYQQYRARDALHAFLDTFLRKELAAWVKTFPDEFFQEMFRLKKWKWTGSSRRPQVVGHYINDLVYSRLAPGVLSELQRINPPDSKGRRKAKHFQWLTENIGNPALSSHVYALIGFMRANDSWDTFREQFTRAFPKRGDNLQLNFTN